jgi:hypothetical protein
MCYAVTPYVLLELIFRFCPAILMTTANIWNKHTFPGINFIIHVMTVVVQIYLIVLSG